jgi:hypothetical protein
MNNWVKFALVGGVPCLISLSIFAPETSHWHYSQWSAAWFQALGSLLAVAVALLYPMASKWKRLKNMQAAIENEMKSNVVILENLIDKGASQPVNGNISINVGLHNAYVSSLDIRCWEQYGYEVASIDLGVYDVMRSVNRHIDAIVNNKDGHELLRCTVQRGEAESAVKKFRDNYS